MATVANLEVKVDADISGFTSAMGRVGESMSKAGEKMSSMGSTLSTRLTAPILGIGAAAIKIAGDAQEMQSKFNVVFSEVGGRVAEDLTTFASAVGRSRTELMDMASQLGDTLKPLGFTQEEAGKTATALTKLATDLSSFNNMSMDEALARLRGTLVGAHENALAFGVVINENTLKAEIAAQGWDDLTGAAAEQAKVQARINLLMQGTSDAQGDAARTAGSFANQMRGMMSSLSELGIEIGTILLPVATNLVTTLRNMLEGFRNADEGTKQMAIVIAGVAAAIGPLLLVGGKTITMLGNMATAVKVIAGIMSPWAIVIAGVAAGAVLVYKNWDKVSGFFSTTFSGAANRFTSAWDDIKTNVIRAAESIYNFVSEVFDDLVEFWREWGDTVTRHIGAIFTGLFNLIVAAINAISSFISVVFDGLTAAWGLWGGDILEIFGTAFDLLSTAFEDGLEALTDALGVWDAIFQGDWEGAWTKYKDYVKGVWDDIKGYFTSGWQWLVEHVPEVAAAFNLIPQSTVGAWDQALVDLGLVEEAHVKAGDAAVQAASDTENTKPIWESFAETISNVTGAFGDTMSGAIGAATDWSAAAAAATTSSNDVNDSLWNLKDGAYWTRPEVEGLASNIGDLETKLRNVGVGDDNPLSVADLSARSFQNALSGISDAITESDGVNSNLDKLGDKLSSTGDFRVQLSDTLLSLGQNQNGLGGVLSLLGSSLVPGFGTALSLVSGTLKLFGIDLGDLGRSLVSAFTSLLGLGSSSDKEYGGFLIDANATEEMYRRKIIEWLLEKKRQGKDLETILFNFFAFYDNPQNPNADIFSQTDWSSGDFKQLWRYLQLPELDIQNIDSQYLRDLLLDFETEYARGSIFGRVAPTGTPIIVNNYIDSEMIGQTLVNAAGG